MTDKLDIEGFLVDAVEFVVKEGGLKHPIKIVHMDAGGAIWAAYVAKDGSSEPLAHPGRGFTALLYPIYTLVVDCEDNASLFVIEEKDVPMRILH